MEKSDKIKSFILWMLLAVVLQAQQPRLVKNIELKESEIEAQKKLKSTYKELRSVTVKMPKILPLTQNKGLKKNEVQ